MSSKRAADDAADAADGSPKKRRTFHNTTQRSGKNAHAAVDQTYGQRNAFGSLDAIGTTAPAGDSDLDCEDDTEALAYLRRVRKEASGIPHVIVAKRAGPQPPPSSASAPDVESPHEVDRDIYNDGTGDFRGYYHDGAYIAYPDHYEEAEADTGNSDENYEWPEGERAEDEDGEVLEGLETSSHSSDDNGRPHNSSVDEIQEAYFTSLTERYLSLREIVQREPPASAIAALSATHPTEVDAFSASSASFTQWSGRLRGTDPLPAQVAAMHKDSIIRLLRIILGGKFLRKQVELRARTSTWIWALLARLPDRGELDYQEIGWIRDLGKRAVLLMIGLAEAQVLQEEYGVDGSDEDHGGDTDVDEGHEGDAAFETGQPCDPSTKAPALVEPRLSPCGDTTETQTSVTNDDEDAPMDLDDGEVSDDSSAPNQDSTNLEDIKARLLAQLDGKNQDDNVNGSPTHGGLHASDDVMKEREEEAAAATVARFNVRATLNMILTVAGEFYGQRDLLEFRDPFVSL
ncbi:Survival motor neuron (SMN) interacting protein 1 (SIP1) [Microdochium nivale]|nr:Survival motor neuron (SMN) interacting protein 1 (SIP1) [Microdochium nivale]